MRIHTIDLEDLGVAGAIAAYVVIGSEGPVLIETGPAATLPALRRGLEALGLELPDIRHALVTHIHFDHAGAAGHLARAGVTIHVHEFGVRHLVDPSRLVASARRLYGDELDQRWGIIEPAPAERVRAVYDGDVLRFGDVTLTAIETPGHARHHHAWQLEADEGPVCFTGDAAACSMAESEFISFPTPPPEFDREAWHETLDRLEREHFVALYPTHFGRVDDPPHHLQLVRAEMEAQVALIAGLVEAGADELTIYENHRDAVAAKAAQLGVPESKRHFYAGESHAQRNVAGVLRYLRKKAEAEQVAAAAINGERV